MKINFLIIAFSILIAFGLTYMLELYTPKPQPILPQQDIATEAKTVPSFSFKDIHERTHNIEDFQGKTVILNFWATWCPPCIVEFPELLNIAANTQDVVLIALSNDLQKSAVDTFISKQDSSLISHPDIVIAMDKNRDITQDIFQSFRLPETIIINPQGKMVRKIIGIIDFDTFSLTDP